MKRKVTNTSHGYGFIEGDDGFRYFLPFALQPTEAPYIKKGMTIEFEIVEPAGKTGPLPVAVWKEWKE